MLVAGTCERGQRRDRQRAGCLSVTHRECPLYVYVDYLALWDAVHRVAALGEALRRHVGGAGEGEIGGRHGVPQARRLPGNRETVARHGGRGALDVVRAVRHCRNREKHERGRDDKRYKKEAFHLPSLSLEKTESSRPCPRGTASPSQLRARRTGYSHATVNRVSRDRATKKCASTPSRTRPKHVLITSRGARSSSHVPFYVDENFRGSWVRFPTQIARSGLPMLASYPHRTPPPPAVNRSTEPAFRVEQQAHRCADLCF